MADFFNSNKEVSDGITSINKIKAFAYELNGIEVNSCSIFNWAKQYNNSEVRVNVVRSEQFLFNVPDPFEIHNSFESAMANAYDQESMFARSELLRQVYDRCLYNSYMTSKVFNDLASQRDPALSIRI